MLYLFSIGVGVGAMVPASSSTARTIDYTAFVAPAMLATAAMNGALIDSTFQIFFKLKFLKIYDAVLATPMAHRRRGARGGRLGDACAAASTRPVFLVVMLAMGLVGSWWALLALPATVLVGFASPGSGMALTTFMRSWQDFEYVQLAIVPMFLFSATFFPVDALRRGGALDRRGHPALPRRRAAPRAVHRARHGRLGDLAWSTCDVIGCVGIAGRLPAPRPAAAAMRLRDDTMRHTEFWARMEHVLGPAYARVWARQQVLAALGGRTVDQALDGGEPAEGGLARRRRRAVAPGDAAMTEHGRCDRRRRHGTWDVAAVQRRTLVVLVVLPGAGRARQPVGIAVAAVLAQEVSGSDALAGLDADLAGARRRGVVVPAWPG